MDWFFNSLVMLYTIKLSGVYSGMASITAGLIEYLISIIASIGYGGIFITMSLESAGVPIPSEVVVPFAGYLSVRGQLDFNLVVLVSTLANLSGSIALYYIGLYYGRKFVVKYGKYLLLEERHLDYVEDLFNRYGSIITFVGRVTPGVRTYISIVAGMGRMSMPPFVFYTVVGSVIWNWLLAYLGVLLGENWESIVPYLDILAIVALVILVVLIYVYLRRRG